MFYTFHNRSKTRKMNEIRWKNYTHVMENDKLLIAIFSVAEKSADIDSTVNDKHFRNNHFNKKGKIPSLSIFQRNLEVSTKRLPDNVAKSVPKALLCFYRKWVSVLQFPNHNHSLLSNSSKVSPIKIVVLTNRWKILYLDFPMYQTWWDFHLERRLINTINNLCNFQIKFYLHCCVHRHRILAL